MLRALRAVTQLCYSRVLKRNIGEKWVKYIINKSIENGSVVLTIFNEVKLIGNSIPNILNYIFFLFKVYGFYHIKKKIFELSMQAVRLRLEPKKCSFYGAILILFLHVASSFLLFIFSFLFTKKIFLYTEMFSTYYKNNFVVSLLLMNVRCEISKKKKKKKN